MRQFRKKVEHGIDHQNDPKLYRQFTFKQEVTQPDGKVKRDEIVERQVRDRITDASIPKGQKGRITYTDWKVVK